jgi:hypothetical protein
VNCRQGGWRPIVGFHNEYVNNHVFGGKAGVWAVEIVDAKAVNKFGNGNFLPILFG